MNKVFWLTDTSFLDVDLPIMPLLSKHFDIDWVIITSSRRYEDDYLYVKSKYNGNFNIVISDAYFFQYKTYKLYKRLIIDASKKSYDCYYMDISGMPYLYPIVKAHLDISKVVVAAHNVKTPKGARYYRMAKLYMKYILNNFKNFQVFSKNQLATILEIKPSTNVFYAPLCLKDYGDIVKSAKENNKITFLFFGNIVKYKRLDILLNAVNSLFLKGIRDFQVIVAGYCPETLWKKEYEPLTNKSIVQLDIRRIPNKEVVQLFARSHYFVMPYQDIAQSGAMTVAFCYNLPIIASNLDTFKEFLNDGIDGFFFESGNYEALAARMEYLIKNHETVYEDLRTNQKAMVEKNLSTDAIVEKYRNYIDSICQN